jgi:predicted unusual protein kinase regulating ubiquinone biosynthesis (AarF/ABC1/UbiB family)
MNSRISRAVLKRPLSSLGGLGAASGLSYAYYEERKAYRLERQGLTAPLPREYSRKALHDYWSARPITVVQRLATVVYELGPCLGSYVVDFKLFPVEPDCVEDVQRMHAVRLREALTRLGPTFVKAGQQLSIRPDLVPAIVLKELQKLCDSVEPVSDEVALRLLREELQCEDLSTIFDDLHFVASASLVSMQIRSEQQCSL